MKYYAAIDPGKNGYISAFDDEGGYYSSSIPLIGKIIDTHQLNEFLVKWKDAHFVIEDVHSIFGVSSKATFSFGFVCGIIEGLLVANNISFTRVQPKVWQKECWQGVPLQQKPSSTGKTMVTDTKAMSLIAAKRLFPEIDFRDNPRCKNPHDGKVDATLIAEYCRRKFSK